MAAAKTARSRAHSGAPAKENLPKLEESLNAFRTGAFDPGSYVKSKCSLNEKLYLDMKFVMCFASKARYLSRNVVRVINEIISKALGAFQATGMDPYSVLPEDDWFNDVCQDAIETLTGEPREIVEQ